MENFLILALAVAAIAVALSVAVRLPRRKAALDSAGLSKSFHGLILFGRDGAYVRLHEKSSGDCIRFTKRFSEGAAWILEVVVSGRAASEALVDQVESGLNVGGGQFTLARHHNTEETDISFSLDGTGLTDPGALEGMARLILRSLRHPAITKYRVEFEGPKDYEAVNKYFGFKQ